MDYTNCEGRVTDLCNLDDKVQVNRNHFLTFYLIAIGSLLTTFAVIGLIVLIFSLFQSCTYVGGCSPGETRCKNNIVEECRPFSGWENRKYCVAPEVCHFDARHCGTVEVACCSE